MKDAIFEPYSPILGQWSGKHIPIIAKINSLTLDRLLSRASNLIVKQKGGAKFSEEEFALIDEIVSFCQSPIRDEQSTNIALDFLMELYDPLIIKSTKSACIACGLVKEIRDWKGSAQTVFRRLVTGDTPETILAYQSHEIGRPKRTIDLEIDVSEKCIPFLKKQHAQKFEKLLDQLAEYGLCKEDLDVARMVLEDSKDHFHETATFSSSEISLYDYVNKILHHEMEIAKRLITEASTEKLKKEFEFTAMIYETQILNSPENLQRLIDQDHDYFTSLYRQYLKTAYRNNFFQKERSANFTGYIKWYLPRRLIDIFKSASGRKARGHNGKESEFDDEKLITKNTSQNDDLFSYFEDHPEDFMLVQKNITPRQYEIFELQKDGYLQKEIAVMLNVSQACISQHAKEIREKLRGILTG